MSGANVSVAECVQAAQVDADGAPLRCAQCGLVCEPGSLVVGELGRQRLPYCCQGCAFVAQTLAQVREAVPAGVNDARVGLPQEGSLAVHGMVCAACALLIEARLRALPAVMGAHVDYAQKRAYVTFDAQRTDLDQLSTVIHDLGYATQRSAEQARKAARLELARLGLAWLAMMQVMMLAAASYVAQPQTIAPDLMQLMRLAQFVMTVPVMLFSAAPIWRSAWHQMKARSVGMDVPVALGLAGAFGHSLVAVFQAAGEVYFDSITMFVALVLGARWLQARALMSAHAFIASAQEALALRAKRVRATATNAQNPAYDVVPAAQLVVGDRVWVAAAEAFAADGLIVQGESSVSQAWLLGEARPERIAQGAAVLAGSVNLEAPVMFEVTRSGERTALAAVGRLAHRAAQSRRPMMELAQTVARYFLWVVLALSVGTWLYWTLVAPAHAWPSVMAVLIATCPCALSLAAPAAWSAAQAAMASAGVLLTRASALETLAKVGTVVFDKTGTLTTASPQLLRVDTDRPDIDALALAASLASASVHPYAQALSQAAAAQGKVLPPAHGLKVYTGAGIEGTMGGQRYRLGHRAFALECTGGTDGLDADGQGAATYLADTRGLLARFDFGEQLRPGGAQVAEQLHALGVDTALLSGDRKPAALAVAQAAGLNAQAVHASMRPQDKCAHLASLQHSGRVVAMVGDGINDAPVLAQADVSVALSSALGGAALAQAQADIIVTNPDLSVIADAVRMARKATRIVKQNFFWAIAYNSLALALAVSGQLAPVLAAVGMAMSALLVIVNAMRLHRGWYAGAQAAQPSR